MSVCHLTESVLLYECYVKSHKPEILSVISSAAPAAEEEETALPGSACFLKKNSNIHHGIHGMREATLLLHCRHRQAT